MPRGVASLFSRLTSVELLKKIEIQLNTKEIRLELPEINRVQVWTSEGEMIQLDKTELFSKTSEISEYLIQFWWPQMDDVSFKLVEEDQLCACYIYLDGLYESQLRDILDMLISISLQSVETIGFVIDRKEISAKYDWKSFFSSQAYVDSLYFEQFGLKVYEEYELNNGTKEEVISFDQNFVYVSIPSNKNDTVILYVLKAG